MVDKVQCLECKLWFKFINSFHLKKCCGLTMKEYKNKYTQRRLCKINVRL